MRGIRIKLSVFEFDILKSLLLDNMANANQIQRTALINVHRQFQRKIERANERRLDQVARERANAL